MGKSLKKFLAALLSMLLVFSLCACGEDPSSNNGGNADVGKNVEDSVNSSNDPTDGAGTSDPSNSGDQETGYVGTWKVIPPDDNPFPPYTLVINEDGTATVNGEPHFWYESLDPKEPEGAIEIAREDNMGYGNDAYITEEGKLYYEINLTVGENSYDHILFERQ